jgi:hypothetical protein
LRAEDLSDKDASATLGGMPPSGQVPSAALVAPQDNAGEKRARKQSILRWAEEELSKRRTQSVSVRTYPFLSLLVRVSRIAALLALPIGVFFCLGGLADKSGETLGIGVRCILGCFTAMIGAETIRLFLDMERNQRQANELLKDIAVLVSREQSLDA